MSVRRFQRHTDEDMAALEALEAVDPAKARTWDAELQRQYRADREHERHRGPEVTESKWQSGGRGPFGTGGGRRRPNHEGSS